MCIAHGFGAPRRASSHSSERGAPRRAWQSHSAERAAEDVTEVSKLEQALRGQVEEEQQPLRSGVEPPAGRAEELLAAAAVAARLSFELLLSKGGGVRVTEVVDQQPRDSLAVRRPEPGEALCRAGEDRAARRDEVAVPPSSRREGTLARRRRPGRPREARPLRHAAARLLGRRFELRSSASASASASLGLRAWLRWSPPPLARSLDAQRFEACRVAGREDDEVGTHLNTAREVDPAFGEGERLAHHEPRAAQQGELRLRQHPHAEGAPIIRPPRPLAGTACRRPRGCRGRAEGAAGSARQAGSPPDEPAQPRGEGRCGGGDSVGDVQRRAAGGGVSERLEAEEGVRAADRPRQGGGVPVPPEREDEVARCLARANHNHPLEPRCRLLQLLGQQRGRVCDPPLERLLVPHHLLVGQARPSVEGGPHHAVEGPVLDLRTEPAPVRPLHTQRRLAPRWVVVQRPHRRAEAEVAPRR
mmetsp:Transcript_26084/g.83743  ORF Transcript_26084/g.83743 Transcript_26084/m.83743 type:complete len:474 (+) Transcript_26084:182-1603(+)